MTYFIFLFSKNLSTCELIDNTKPSMSGAEEYRVVTSDVVNIGVTSNVNSFQSIKRFNKDLTIANFKVRNLSY